MGVYQATRTVEVAPGLRLPRPMVRAIDEAVMGRALGELRSHAQQLQEA